MTSKLISINEKTQENIEKAKAIMIEYEKKHNKFFDENRHISNSEIINRALIYYIND